MFLNVLQPGRTVRLAVIMCGAIVAALLGLLERSEQGGHPIALAVVNGLAVGLDQVVGRTKATPGQALTDAGLQVVLDRALRSEVIFQRAAELRLVRNDAVLRGRLMQLARELAKSAAQDEDISEQSLLAYYETRKAGLSSQVKVRFDEIFIPDLGSDEWPEDLRIAQIQLLQGERFEDVQQALGEQAPFDWGDGFTPRRALVSEYGEAVAQALSVVPVGEVSEPVQGNAGFHIVRVKARQDATPLPFLEVQDRLERELRQTMESESATQWVDKLLEEAEIWVAPDAVERMRRYFEPMLGNSSVDSTEVP